MMMIMGALLRGKISMTATAHARSPSLLYRRSVGTLGRRESSRDSESKAAR
jgi:hypothetical protein